MPVLPRLYRSVATAADTRILDSRQLGAATRHAAQSLSSSARHLLKRIPTLIRRQNDRVCDVGYVAGCYQGIDAGPAPGAVVGIVLGSIAGFLIIMWLLWILSSGTSFIRTQNLQEEEVVVRRHGSRSGSPRRHSHRSHRESYHAEVRQSSPRRDRVIRQERIVREVPVTQTEHSRVRGNVIVEESRPERRVENDDIVEVIEEHSSISGAPPPRRKSRRSSNNYR